MGLLLSRRELLTLALVFLLSLPAVTTRLYSSDEVQYFSYLRSLYFDRDVSFENEYRYFYDHAIAQSIGFHETFLERQTAVGRRVNYATMGCAMLWLPFYAVADAVVAVTGSAERDGFSKPYVRAVAYGSAFYGFLSVLLSIQAVRSSVFGLRYSGFGSRDPGGVEFDATFWSGLAVWIGTPLIFYMYVAPPFSHATSAFGVAVFVNVWLHVRQRWSAPGMFALGVCAAFLATIREQDVFVALGPAVDFALAVTTPKTQLPTPKGDHGGFFRALIPAVAAIGGFAIGYLPQLLAYNALNGYPGPAQHVARKMYWYSPHGLQVLFSPSHGLFVWTPLAALAIVGLVIWVLRADKDQRDQRRIAVSALVMMASQVYVAGSVASWTVAGAYGQRRFVCLTVVLVMGVAALFAVAKSRVIAVVVVLCVWWNIALMFQFATGLMDRQRLEPGRNAYHALVTVPRQAPSLVYRYLTNRESFYHPPQKPQ